MRAARHIFFRYQGSIYKEFIRTPFFAAPSTPPTKLWEFDRKIIIMPARMCERVAANVDSPQS
jgi:hypothetical protein